MSNDNTNTDGNDAVKFAKATEVAARASSAASSAAEASVANDADASYIELIQLLDRVKPEQLKQLRPEQLWYLLLHFQQQILHLQQL